MLRGSVGLLLVLLIGGIVVGLSSEPKGGIPEGTQEIDPGAARHVDGSIYSEAEIPAGGDHASRWANCGFYSTSIATESVIHSLEHGAVWVAYDAAMQNDELDSLREIADSDSKVLVSPMRELDTPLVITSWGYQLGLDAVDDPRLTQFVTEFAGSIEAPEPGGACVGGLGVPG